MSVHSEAQMYRRFVELAKLLNVYLNHWPKHEKYALASRVRNTAYQLYDFITEAQKRYHKKTTLTNLDIVHEQLRMQLHLAHELGYFRFKDGKTVEQSPDQQAHRRYEAISLLVDEIGRMIGGWIQADRQKGSASSC